MSSSNLRWVLFRSARCACHPRLRLMRAFSLLLMFRGMQVFEAAMIDSATRVSKTRALHLNSFSNSESQTQVD